MKLLRVLACVCACIAALPFVRPAHATSWLDLSVSLKTLPLLTNKITGTASVAVIYDAASAESKADAAAIKNIIDGGLEVPGGIKLTVQLVSMSELSRLADAKIAFLAHGLPAADYGGISAAAAATSVLTICTDLDCVRANKCVIGVISQPHVEIYYSSAAAEAAKISFAPAFTMLVNQI